MFNNISTLFITCKSLCLSLRSAFRCPEYSPPRFFCLPSRTPSKLCMSFVSSFRVSRREVCSRVEVRRRCFDWLICTWWVEVRRQCFDWLICTWWVEVRRHCFDWLICTWWVEVRRHCFDWLICTWWVEVRRRSILVREW